MTGGGWPPLVRLPVIAAFCLSVGAGCASQQPPSPKLEAPPTLHQGPLTDFVPAAGVRWLVVGRPRDIAAIPELRNELALLFPERRLDAFAETTKLDLTALPSALIAGFDFATLYMAEVRSAPDAAAAAFEERLVSGAVVHSRHPAVRTIQGIVGRTPETLLTVRGQLIAVSVGDPTPVRAAEAFATGRLKRSPSVLQGSALRRLPADLERAPVRFYAPGPFSGEWERGARGLLGVTRAVGIALWPADATRVRAAVVLSGEYAELGAERATLLRGAWTDIAQSSTGRLLALDAGDEGLSIRDDEHELRLELTLPIQPIIRGIHAAVAGDVADILDVQEAGNAHPPAHLRPQKR